MTERRDSPYEEATHLIRQVTPLPAGALRIPRWLDDPKTRYRLGAAPIVRTEWLR